MLIMLLFVVVMDARVAFGCVDVAFGVEYWIGGVAFNGGCAVVGDGVVSVAFGVIDVAARDCCLRLLASCVVVSLVLFANNTVVVVMHDGAAVGVVGVRATGVALSILLHMWFVVDVLSRCDPRVRIGACRR